MVYGYPAIAAAIENMGVDAVAIPDVTPQLTIQPWNKHIKLGTPGSHQDDELTQAFKALLDCYGQKPPALHVNVHVTLPAGAGLGCSAAIGVAIVKAVDAALGIQHSMSEVAEIALTWEQVFHGNPSGVDSTVASHGGMIRFAKHTPIQFLYPAMPIHLIVALTQQTSSTKDIVATVARQHSHNPRRITSVFEGIATLVNKAAQAISAGQLEELGHCLDLNHALLSSLLLSTNELEHLCTAARNAGALGAKLTGAGGGGAMVALAPSMDHANVIYNALAGLSRQCFTVTIHEHGIRESTH